MKKEYDFTEAKRGKFYRENVKLNLPVYLDEEAFSFVQSIADKHSTDPSSIANQLIRSDMQLAKVMK